MQTSTESARVYDAVTFWEEWYLRQFGERAMTDNGIRVRNAAEDLYTEDVEYWADKGCTRVYEAACCVLNLQAWWHQ